jgi:hypothetical protein
LFLVNCGNGKIIDGYGQIVPKKTNQISVFQLQLYAFT